MTPDDSPWYSMDDLPAGRVMVRVQWAARIFAAARDRRGGWFTYKSGEIVKLPPRGRKGERWTLEPDRWQPVDPAKWAWPRGVAAEPLPVMVQPRMWSSHMSFSATEQAESDGLERSRSGDVIEPRWWRDVTQIRYEPRGEVSRKNCEGRVMRALAHCGAGDDRALARLARDPTMADLAEAVAGWASAVDRGWLEYFQPLPVDDSDFVEAMSWVTALDPVELRPRRRSGSYRGVWRFNRAQLVLLYRAVTVPLSWADIGMQFKVSGERARQVYAQSIDACWRVANGAAAYRHLQPVDQVAALRERNRAYHRSRG